MNTTCRLAALASLLLTGAFGQAPRVLTLAEADEIALRQHPRIESASLTAQATGKGIAQAKSALYPTLSANLTSAGAEQDTAVAADALTTSALANRAASGIVLNQLLLDFGRTNNLIETARLRASAQNQNVSATRAQILLQTEQAYYQALRAESVLRVARATVEIRQLTLRQVSSLAQASLKSTLDVSFAEVSLSEAELSLYQSENDVRSSQARLSAALGYPREESFTLVDEPIPSAPPSIDVDDLIRSAFKDRPDLANLQLNREAALRFAEAEKKLRFPAVSMLGVAGGAPVRDDRLRGSYSGIGLNVSIPFLNGGLFKARREEAEIRAQAVGKDVQDLSLQISRDVQVSWLEANTAYRRLDVTARLVVQAEKALRLAQARYDLGLGSIVELNQAQLNQTSAQITAAGAKYDYLSRLSALNYATGVLR